METRLVKINNMEDCKKDMEEAGELIKAGELVAFPTETVYGLGGNGLLPDAAKKIYAAKGRPSDNPLILHVCDMQMVESLVKEIPDNARRAMEHFWPGPMTVILQKADQVPDCVTGGLDTVAIRMPDHPVALELIRRSDRSTKCEYIWASKSDKSRTCHGRSSWKDSDDLRWGSCYGRCRINDH